MRHTWTFRLLGTALCLFGLSLPARADVVNGFELFPFAGQSTWEVSTAVTVEMKDQGKFPYCGLYAMSSFLEIWGDTTHTGYVFPSIDESYISLGYDRVVGSPGGGTHPMWLHIATHIFGAVPKAARLKTAGTWPVASWATDHLKLVDTKVADSVLTGKFTYGNSTKEFTGRNFLTDVVRIDLTQFYGLFTNYKEKLQKPTSPNTEESVPSPLRMGTFQATANNMQMIAQKVGGDTRMASVAPDKLWAAAKLQLYSRRPVYLAINAGLTKDKFRKYGVITESSLVPEGQGLSGPHAVVAVAHCDKTNSVDRICQRFGPYMKQMQVDECIAVQNSWGTAVNDRGYFCVAPDAWKRVAQAVLIEKSLIKTNP